MWSDLVRQRLASQIHNIKHWEVTNCSFENLPAFEATWFIDPPYQVAGKHYKFSKIDFSLLSAFSKDRKGQTIVCENEGADWLPFSPLCNQFSSLKKQTKEAVWVS